MEPLRLYSMMAILFFDASLSQQFDNPLVSQTTKEAIYRDRPAPHSGNQHITTSIPEGSSDSKRSLLDLSASGSFSPLTDTNYYDSVPYYAILDYYYIEQDESADTNTNISKINAPTGAHGNESRKNTHHPNDDQANSETNRPLSTTKNETVSNCDVITHFGCDVRNFERCDLGTQTCKCIKGYLNAASPTHNTGSCTAAKFLHGDIKIHMPIRKVNTLSVEIIRDKLWDYIKNSMKKKGAEDILLAFSVLSTDMRSSENSTMLVITYDIGLKRDASSDISSSLQIKLEKGIQGISNTHGLPLDFDTIVGQMSAAKNGSDSVYTEIFTTLTEISPCSSPEHTYCSPDALCRAENGSQICHCLPGFKDISPDPIRFPGEVCEGQCLCENQGTCVTKLEDHDVKECSCTNWFFGSRCHINGKELLYISSSIIGCLAIIVTIYCCCRTRIGHRKRHSDSSVSCIASDPSVLKIPRVWMETQYSDNGSVEKNRSPPSIQRISIATECNPYYDEYILEDIPQGPLSCLHLDMTTQTY